MDSELRPLRIAINGYGRIGRCFLRALTESVSRRNFVVVAINDPADLASIAYLTRSIRPMVGFRGGRGRR